MKPKKTVLLIWFLRYFALVVAIFPIMDNIARDANLSSVWVLVSAAISMAIAFSLMYIKFISCRLVISSSEITYQVGILLRRTVLIKSKNICAVRLFRTPLLESFGLCSVVVYCEGATFLLPPTDLALAKKIKKLSERDDLS